MCSEMEAAAHAQLAFHPNSSVHEFPQPGRNSQTQSRATISATHGSVSLCKSLKDRSLLFSRNSDTRIYDCKMEFDAVIRPRICPDVNNYFALLRELDGVTDQIHNDLSQTSGVPHECVRDVGLKIVGEFQPFLVGSQTQCFQRVAKVVAQIELDRINFQLLGFDR